MGNRSRAAATFLTIVLAPMLTAFAQDELSHAQLVQQRIGQLREKLSRTLPNMRSWRKIDEEATVEALTSIIAEERTKSARGAMYHSALEELGHYPDHRVAVRTLVENIDTGVSPAPRFGLDPLEGYIAAQTLVKCGAKARREILHALSRSQSKRNLYLLAYVLVRIDQDQGPFDVELTVARLRREIRWLEQLMPANDAGRDNPSITNLRHVIELIRDPEFKQLRDFPLAGGMP